MYAFLDTNQLLHYPFPDQVDWCTHTAAKEVTLVIAQVVFRELNRHKGKPESRKLRGRAATVLKWFDAFIDEPAKILREGVKLLLLPRDPILDFSSQGLSRDLNDDWLIASVIQFHFENPESTIALFTEDRGLKVKAIGLGIPTMRLPERLRLPDELDPIEMKLRETEYELQRFRDAQPNLKLAFEDDSNHFKARLRLSPKITSEQLAAKMAAVKEKHPKMVDVGNYRRLLALSMIGATTLDEYNKQIEVFYADYEKYLIRMNEFEDKKRTTIMLEIKLLNIGSAPARDVHIFMHFPNGLAIHDEASFESVMTEPIAPEAPLEKMQAGVRALTHMHDPSAFASFRMPSIRSVHSNVSGWTVKRSNSYDVRQHVKQLTHGLNESFETLFAIFDSCEAVKSFAIDYELIAANLPDKVPGKLYVIVES